MSRSPPPEKYASAFSPPSVNCLTLRRRFSAGSSTGEGLFPGLCPAGNTAAERLTRSAKGNSIFVLINLKRKSARGARRETLNGALTLNRARPPAKHPPRQHRGITRLHLHNFPLELNDFSPRRNGLLPDRDSCARRWHDHVRTVRDSDPFPEEFDRQENYFGRT